MASITEFRMAGTALLDHSWRWVAMPRLCWRWMTGTLKRDLLERLGFAALLSYRRRSLGRRWFASSAGRPLSCRETLSDTASSWTGRRSMGDRQSSMLLRYGRVSSGFIVALRRRAQSL